MSTHIFLDGLPVERLRSLLEPCNFCDARAGEPCIQVEEAGQTAGQYICPDGFCDQLYERAHDALSCVMHIDLENSIEQ